MMNTKPSPVSASPLYSAPLLHAYPRVTALAESIYSPAAYVNAQAYLPFAPGPDASAFYSPLNSECGDTWRTLTAQTAAAAAAAAAWVYEPTMMGYPYPPSYGNLDVRRKNATRESTSTLKAWLYEHIKNPYPTKGEKIMLAIITKMTLTQVSTWFANARRRLKKENKMQWSPRNRTGDDDDDDDDKNSDNDDVIIRERTDRDDSVTMHDDDEDVIVDAGNDDQHHGCHHDRAIDVASIDRCYTKPRDTSSASAAVQGLPEFPPSASGQDSDPSQQQRDRQSTATRSIASGSNSTSGAALKSDARDNNNHPTGTGSASSSSSSSVEKPRIWSLADVATSGTPSSGRRSPTSGLLPVRVNDFLNHTHHLHHHHHRFPHDLPQAPSAAAAAASLSSSGPSLVHHSFQPWAKRFLPSAHSVHPFANKLLSGYVSYGHHHHQPSISIGVRALGGQESGAGVMSPSCSGSEVTRSINAAAGGADTGIAVLSSNQRIEFSRITDKMAVAKNSEGFPLISRYENQSRSLGKIHHSSSTSSSSSSSNNNNSNCSPSPSSPSPSPPTPPLSLPPPPAVSSSSSFPSSSALPPPPPPPLPPPLKRL